MEHQWYEIYMPQLYLNLIITEIAVRKISNTRKRFYKEVITNWGNTMHL